MEQIGCSVFRLVCITFPFKVSNEMMVSFSVVFPLSFLFLAAWPDGVCSVTSGISELSNGNGV